MHFAEHRDQIYVGLKTFFNKASIKNKNILFGSIFFTALVFVYTRRRQGLATLAFCAVVFFAAVRGGGWGM